MKKFIDNRVAPFKFQTAFEPTPPTNPHIQAMKYPRLIATATLLLAGSSFGASGLIGTFINVSSSNLGGSPIWYDASSSTSLANFSGFSFGSFNPSAGGTLNLTGAEIDTWKNGGSDVTGTTAFYRIYSGSPSGSFTALNVNWTANATFADASGSSYSGSGDQKWAGSSAWNPLNILAGLSNGNYTLESYLTASSTDGTLYANADGSNFKATFSVIPESASTLLGVVGATLLLRRRRR